MPGKAAALRIAMLGTRGVPARYSGFETCVEELGARLAARGHEVTVYCRVPHVSYPGATYRGMRLVRLPTIRSKHLDTIAHTLLSSLHALAMRFDVALYFNVGNSPVTWIPRAAGQRVVLNVDGLDWKRKKWGRFARWYIRSCERWATRFPHRVVTDSRRVQQYYRERHGAASTYIAYGAEPASAPPGEHLRRFGLEPGRYVLFVGRLVPENCAHHLVEAGGAGRRAVLERLLKDPALVAVHGARGLERVRRHYSWDGVTDAYEELFREIAGDAR